MPSATMPNYKVACDKLWFKKNKIKYLFLIWSKMFSEIGSLFQNSWPFYDRTSWLSVIPFCHAFYYALGFVFQNTAAASHPFFSREIIRYERRKDINRKAHGIITQ